MDMEASVVLLVGSNEDPVYHLSLCTFIALPGAAMSVQYANVVWKIELR